MAATAMGIEEALLLHLQSHAAIVDSGDWAARSSFDHGAVMDVIKSLQGSGFVEAQVCLCARGFCGSVFFFFFWFF
jgi:hypothetical protein